MSRSPAERWSPASEVSTTGAQGNGQADLSDVEHMLKEQCERLALFVDGRLAAYHQDLLGALARMPMARPDPLDTKIIQRPRYPSQGSCASGPHSPKQCVSQWSRAAASAAPTPLKGAPAAPTEELISALASIPKGQPEALEPWFIQRQRYPSQGSCASGPHSPKQCVSQWSRTPSPTAPTSPKGEPATPTEELVEPTKQPVVEAAWVSEDLPNMEDATPNSDGSRAETPNSNFSEAERHRRMSCRAVETDNRQVRRFKTTLTLDLAPPSKEARSWGRSRTLKAIVDSHRFETFICMLIISNICFFGYEVGATMGEPEDHIPMGFFIFECFFTACFTMELLLRIMARGMCVFFRGSERNWNIIDLCLVSVSLAEACMELVSVVGSPKFGYIRIVRMARIVRIFRVVRIMKFFRPLRILVFSISNTVRSLFWTLTLLATVVYCFGLVFAMAASPLLINIEESDPRLVEHFGSLGLSIMSLFKCISGGIDWKIPADALATIHPIWVALFVMFISFCHFAVLNVVTGVVCHTAIEAAQHDQDIATQSRLATKQKYVAQLETLFMDLDLDRCGQITLSQFEERLKDDDLSTYFEALDLTVDQAWSLFKLLDSNDNRAVGIDDFVAGCLKLRGPARSIDIHMLMYENKWAMKKLARIMEELRKHRASYSASCYSASLDREDCGAEVQRRQSFTSERAAPLEPDGFWA